MIETELRAWTARVWSWGRGLTPKGREAALEVAESQYQDCVPVIQPYISSLPSFLLGRLQTLCRARCGA